MKNLKKRRVIKLTSEKETDTQHEQRDSAQESTGEIS